MGSNLFQSMIAVSNDVANQKHKGKVRYNTREKYKQLSKEMYDSFGLVISPINYVPKTKKKFTLVPDKMEVNVVEDKMIINHIESIDRQIDAVLLLIKERMGEGKICIGRSHTFISVLKELLAERRVLKSGLVGSGNVYLLKTERARTLMSNYKYDKSVFVDNKPAYKYSNSLYKNDLMHIIELSDKFSLDFAYVLCKELVNVEVKCEAVRKLESIF